jgi:hypothetical protein
MRLMMTGLLATALLAQAAAAKPAPAKPAATPHKITAAEPSFDARNPSNLVELLAALDAHAEIVRTQDDAVMLKVSSPAGGFQAQFGGCDAHGRACAGLQFDASADQRTATLAEINRFNQSSLTCRMIQDPSGKPHVLYSTLVFASTGRPEMLTQIDAWRGCIADFGSFLKDPTAYLASAP